ncbi:MAG: class I SAM-dependent methyltransferase [Bryobacterales bacterium]|nr:class I SAM-dependent methyltransferase [Bryobacterales bacterium]
MTHKHSAELDFWIRHWDRCIRHHGDWTPAFWNGFDDTTPELSESEYKQARRDLAVKQLREVERMAAKPEGYLDRKTVVEIGPGPVGMLEVCDAAVKVAIEPLADAYREHGLLLPEARGTVYLCKGIEDCGLISNMADIVVASNCLDHVDDLDVALREIRRILRPGGELFLNVEVDHAPTVCEPIVIREKDLGAMFREYDCTHFARVGEDRLWARAVYRLR